MRLQEGNGTEVVVFDAFSPMPAKPSRGLNIARVDLGDVVDIVVQNAPANAFGGDYRCRAVSTRKDLRVLE